nr:immunoglobulin heavy chain junction region [Mus musculus]
CARYYYGSSLDYW